MNNEAGGVAACEVDTAIWTSWMTGRYNTTVDCREGIILDCQNLANEA